MKNESDSQPCAESAGFNPQAVRAQTLSHLIRMASMGIKGFKVYAWRRAEERSAHPSKIWSGIDEDLKTEMLKTPDL